MGGFSYSEGLEAAFEDGRISNEAQTLRWLQDQLHLSLARSDLAVASKAFRAWQRPDAARRGIQSGCIARSRWVFKHVHTRGRRHEPSTARRHQQGSTLVGIGVVLLIIGLLLGAVLKGQELIASARVGNLIKTMNAYKAAINGFQDRYRIVPGDSSQAATIVGNGAVNCSDTCNDGLVNSYFVYTVDNHLSASGFMSLPATGLTNPAGDRIYMWDSNFYQNSHGQSRSTAAATGLYTGYKLSSNFLGEMDNRIDDDLPRSGLFRNATNTDWRPCLKDSWQNLCEDRLGVTTCGVVVLLTAGGGRSCKTPLMRPITGS